MANNGDSDSPVGYCNPPRHTRFKKGQSGNPKGRTKKNKNWATVLIETLNEKVAINENGKRKKITKLEAMAKQTANKAASGDVRAARMLFDLIQQVEIKEPTASASEPFGEVDQTILRQLIKRIRRVGESEDGDVSGSD